jgi:outer membrane protein
MTFSIRLPKRSAVFGLIAIQATSTLAFADASHAETLRQALAAAYRYSPVLDAQRARLRAVDEGVSIANSRYRPRISATGNVTLNNTTTDGAGALDVVLTPTGLSSPGGTSRSATYGVGITQPIFSGFQITNGVRISEANVRAEREALRDQERQVLLATVRAYMSVLIASDEVKLQEQGSKNALRQLELARDRLKINALTNTDVSQSEGRRVLAQAALARANASLRTARTEYLRVVGHEPSHLADATVPLNRLPKTLQEALAIAQRENPALVSALYGEEAARIQVELVRGRFLPTVSLDANVGDSHQSTDTGSTRARSASIAGRVTMPIYEGGQTHAELRQAKHFHVGAIQAIEGVRAQVQQAVSAAWVDYEAARTQVDFDGQQIRALEATVVGVRTEEKIGQRAFLDLLNADQELVAGKVRLAISRRNLVLASYTVLSQVGRLDVTHLGVSSVVYDPAVHYEEVRRKWFGISITHADGRHELIDASGGPVVKK